MTALVLDAGALIAIDRGDREMLARLRAAQHEGLDLKTHPLVVAQAWRDPAGRQARLARLLAATNVIPLEAATGRRAGELLAKARMSDAIDAALVLIADAGDRIVTSDPVDISALAAAAGVTAAVIDC